MIREQNVNETVAQYEQCLQPQNLAPHDVAIGNDKDALRMKYENVLYNPNKIFYVSHIGPTTELFDEEAGRAYYRCTVADLGVFTEEVAAVNERCPQLAKYHPTIDRLDNCALVAEWQVKVPMPAQYVQDALDWLAANAAVMVERDFLQEIVIGKKDMNLTKEERFAAAQKYVNLVIDEGLNQNTGVFRNIHNIVVNGDADLLAGMWPTKKKAGIGAGFKPLRGLPMGGNVWIDDGEIQAAVQPIQAAPLADAELIRVHEELGRQQRQMEEYRRMREQFAAYALRPR